MLCGVVALSFFLLYGHNTNPQHTPNRASVTTGIHGAFGLAPILVLPTEEAIDQALPWIITTISTSAAIYMWVKDRREKHQQQEEQQREREAREQRTRQAPPPPPPPPSAPQPPSAPAEAPRVRREGRAVRTLHMETTQTSPPRRVSDARGRKGYGRTWRVADFALTHTR